MGERIRKGDLEGNKGKRQQKERVAMNNLRMNCFWVYLLFRSDVSHKANSAHPKPIYLPVMKLFYAASSIDDWGVCRGFAGNLGISSLLAGNVAEKRVLFRFRFGLLLVGSVLSLRSVPELCF